MYYSNCPMTLYLQVHFLKFKCTENVKSTMKNAMKSEKKEKILSLKKQISPSTKKCKKIKRNLIETQSQENSIKNRNIRKILSNKKK